jgi:hypothetical protein
MCVSSSVEQNTSECMLENIKDDRASCGHIRKLINEEIKVYLTKDCVICLDPYSNDLLSNKEISVFVPCGHLGHSVCILEWFKTRRTCMVCKNKVTNRIIFNNRIDLIAELDNCNEKTCDNNKEPIRNFKVVTAVGSRATVDNQ